MLPSNLLFKHDVWHLHKCSDMSISEHLWCAHSNDVTHQALVNNFFPPLPPLSTVHPHSLFSQKHSCVIGQWHSWASSALFLPHQNCHLPGSWSARQEGLIQHCLTQWSTWFKGWMRPCSCNRQFCRNCKAEVKLLSHGVPKIFALTLLSHSENVTPQILSVFSFL